MMDKTKMFTCCQINLHRSRVASSELNSRSENVVFITEPFTANNHVRLLNRSHTRVLAHDGPHRPRAALRIDQAVQPWMVSNLCSPDLCVAAIKVEGKLTYVASLYLDINLDVEYQPFLRLIEACQRDSIPLIVAMDSNAHSPLWGSAERNGRGENLEDILLSRNLTVMNHGCVPTFKTVRAESVIDVTVMNAHAMNNLNLTEWRVCTEESFSDHRYIKFNLGRYEPQTEQYRNIRKADWELFQVLLDTQTLPEIREDGSNLDDCALALEQLIQKALDEACPLKRAVGRPPNPWWTPELDRLRSETVRLSQKCHRSDEDWQSYRDSRRHLAREIRKAKRVSWREFCNKAETAKDISKIIKILRPKPQAGIGLFHQGGRPLTPSETLNNLMDAHFLESTRVDDDEIVEAAPVRFFTDTESEKFDKYVSINKVAKSFKSFGSHKAPGPDGFKPLVLQKLTPGLYHYIAVLYRLAVKTGYAPKVWRKMKVVFLPKAGKTDYGSAKSYRPITLSNFLLKGLERLIQWYISDKIVTNPLFAQHAYTTGRSCDTALSEVVDFIEKNNYRKQHVLAVSLDCSGAFDRIKFDSAEEAMSDMGIPSNIRAFYKHVLEERTVTADLQGERIKRKPKRGSPQGGVLSPLIWNLIMHGILSQFKGKAIKVVGYADDIILLVAGKDPNTLVSLMNKALHKVLRWGQANGLVFNPTKTCAVRFSQCKRFSKWEPIVMDGTEVMYDSSMKYLGVTLQSHLTWGTHVHERVKKATATLNLANAAIGQKWGFNPERALWVYTAMARSVVTYGALVWAQDITDTIKGRLTRLQRKALLGMCHSMRSTPSAGMEVVLGVQPLDIYNRLTAALARVRTRRLLIDGWDGLGSLKKGHRRKLDDIVNLYCDPYLPVDAQVLRRLWLENETVEEPDLKLYTDGSKMEGGITGAGWAACHGDTVIAEESTYLGTDASVFQAEITAIEHAVRWVLECCDPGTNVMIYSDSQAAIKAIFKETVTSKTVQACKEIIIQAKENQRIGIEWIKGHADYTGNELADYLARKGAEMICYSVAPEVPLPTSTVKQRVKDHFLAEWQNRWIQSDDCRQSKIFFPKVDGKKVKKLSKLKRDTLNLLVQVGTGHALVGYHLGKWTALNDTCELCLEDEESIEHLYFECPALARMRFEMEALDNDKTIERKLVNYFNVVTLRDLFSSRSSELRESDGI